MSHVSDPYRMGKAFGIKETFVIGAIADRNHCLRIEVAKVFLKDFEQASGFVLPGHFEVALHGAVGEAHGVFRASGFHPVNILWGKAIDIKGPIGDAIGVIY